MAYNKKVETYLSHAENRIKICSANYLLFSAKEDEFLAEQAARGIYSWIGKAQDQHQEDHF